MLPGLHTKTRTGSTGPRRQTEGTWVHGSWVSSIPVNTSLERYHYPTFNLVNGLLSVALLLTEIVLPVLAKYAGHAGHVRQTSADVRQGAQTLPDILSGRAQYTENVRRMSGIKHYICWSLTEKNVRQGIKMSGRALSTCRTLCPADLK